MRSAGLRVEAVRLRGHAHVADADRLSQAVVDALAARLQRAHMRAHVDHVRIRCTDRRLSADALAARIADAIVTRGRRT